MLQPVILCGGSGTRLWPLSRQAFPKQFVPLVHGRSLLALTLERVAPLCDPAAGVVCVGAEAHRFLLKESIAQAGLQGAILLESHPRNTAAAMTLAALRAPPGQLLLFCPADHHIPDADAFAAAVRDGMVCAAEGQIVVFGIQPTYPSTAYGYIERGAARADHGHAVQRFIEKPDAERAQQLLLSGDVYWNAGIFLCTAGTLVAAMQQHAPDILAQCKAAMDGAESDGDFIRPAAAALAACRAESFDYAVMERHHAVCVVPFTGQWSDVGSWNAVAEFSAADANGNRVEGNGMALQGSNNFIHAQHRRVVALGTHDLLIIDTPDAVLVVKRGMEEEVKAVVGELVRRKSPEAVEHRKVVRPWGSYDSIQSGPRFQVKRIEVKPGASLSLQRHFHRAEHWIVVKGTAEVTRGAEVFLLSENQSTYIPLGEVHRLHNPGRTPLEMIEVQSGSYLDEDDIVRLDDNYGRTEPPGAPGKPPA